jgi:hypothetical protein
MSANFLSRLSLHARQTPEKRSIETILGELMRLSQKGTYGNLLAYRGFLQSEMASEVKDIERNGPLRKGYPTYEERALIASALYQGQLILNTDQGSGVLTLERNDRLFNLLMADLASEVIQYRAEIAGNISCRHHGDDPDKYRGLEQKALTLASTLMMTKMDNAFDDGSQLFRYDPSKGLGNEMMLVLLALSDIALEADAMANLVKDTHMMSSEMQSLRSIISRTLSQYDVEDRRYFKRFDNSAAYGVKCHGSQLAWLDILGDMFVGRHVIKDIGDLKNAWVAWHADKVGINFGEGHVSINPDDSIRILMWRYQSDFREYLLRTPDPAEVKLGLLQRHLTEGLLLFGSISQFIDWGRGYDREGATLLIGDADERGIISDPLHSFSIQRYDLALKAEKACSMASAIGCSDQGSLELAFNMLSEAIYRQREEVLTHVKNKADIRIEDFVVDKGFRMENSAYYIHMGRREVMHLDREDLVVSDMMHQLAVALSDPYCAGYLMKTMQGDLNPLDRIAYSVIDMFVDNLPSSDYDIGQGLKNEYFKLYKLWTIWVGAYDSIFREARYQGVDGVTCEEFSWGDVTNHACAENYYRILQMQGSFPEHKELYEKIVKDHPFFGGLQDGK